MYVCVCIFVCVFMCTPCSASDIFGSLASAIIKCGEFDILIK